MKAIVKVVVPALNEENAIGHVISAIPKEVDEVVVVDNGSRDDTAAVARKSGASCLREETPGYGRACLCGLHYLSQQQPLPEVVVFLDADYSDYPEEMPLLWAPVLADEADLVVGSRVLGNCEAGALTFAQKWGNALAVRLLYLLYGLRCSDLGPFRAIRYSSLLQLQLQDKTYGWNIEMHIKAAKAGLRYQEVPVSYRKRIGFSKISGTASGVLKAGYKIIATLIHHY